MILLTPKEFLLYLDFKIDLAKQKKATIQTCGHVEGDDAISLSEVDGMIKAYQDVKDHMDRANVIIEYDRQWGMGEDFHMSKYKERIKKLLEESQIILDCLQQDGLSKGNYPHFERAIKGAINLL